MKRLASEIKNKWRNYKYRFVPWQIFNWKDERTGVKRVEKSVNFDDEQEVAIYESLKCLFEKFSEAEREKKSADDVMLQYFGFNLKKRASSIEGAGNGVFVSKGVIPKAAIAAMYPGTIYYPSEPLLFQSINNPFILRCVDGIMIDGNHKGISKMVYRSCSGRDMIGPYKPCDTSWLTDATTNPLAVGQFVNNQSKGHPANVTYQEVNIPISFPLNLRKYLPNVHYCNRFSDDSIDLCDADDSTEIVLMRVVVLLAISEIKLNEELFSSYFTEVF